MAKGDWWLKLDMKDWRGDVQLRRLKRENRASWLDACIIMRMSGDYKISGSKDDLAHDLNLTLDEFDDFLNDLKRTGTADVTLRHAQVTPHVTLVSRRYKREAKAKEQARLRKRKERGHADVTPKSRDIVKSKEKEVRKEEINTHTPNPTVAVASESASLPDKEIHLGKIVAGVMGVLNLKTIAASRRTEWLKEGELAFANGFSAEQFVECFRLLNQQQWRTGPVKPSHVSDNLPNLEKVRLEIQQRSRNGHGESLPTLEEKLAEDKRNNAAIKPPPKPKQPETEETVH